MYKTFKAALCIVWILDILNLPFMEFMDTTLPINAVAWLLIWLMMPTSSTVIRDYTNKNS